MTPTDIQRLRALAEKATPEMYWWKSGVPADSGIRMLFIAALDPATVIALCDKALHTEPAQAQVSDPFADKYHEAAPPSDASGVRAGLR